MGTAARFVGPMLNLLDEKNQLEPTKTEEAILRLNRDIARLIELIRTLQSGGTVQVSGVSGIVFIDTVLTANFTVTTPSASDDALLIYSFLQSTGAPWTVTWPAAFDQKPLVEPTLNWETVCIFRKRGGATPYLTLLANPTMHLRVAGI